ncbi:phosphoribosylglycinamide formyltransferase [Methylobacterium aerolatum]|uniref:Phosphoribosylglycinamide formyltransferase n=1 Tax=Methylobacterium aerolatum TaxID=418708 RepID=A0ABU0HYB8_9HYPH|nr:phosphoribosylglycinamide formyltransferase [Methylobacterium aerolatum]MDQ0447339.1 phosphoribosylglycinamide formyltransferase-1 [Methylobacterium aerolatum]GJD37003.1 Phosphoribosylglycinamide formyltransferase [Methylobacterium aerolatum]
MAGSGKVRVAVLISGRGSNMVALAEAARDPAYPAEIVLVLANDPQAEGLARADAMGVATRAIDHRAFPDRATFDAAIDAALREAQVDLVVLAGFMRILTPGFVEGWAGRMINIHPSLLPLFKGTHTHAQALAAGVRLHGCTVHFVVPELDAGPIVAQAAVPVHEGDDPDSLAARVIVQERRLYPAALALIAGGQARLEGDRVVIDRVPADGALFSL